ncbi:MAG: FIST C-terminal domain-containing protein [Planctomycetes bacterium]|nr:FIST C-terminal domain-containing protein [Planctomycetota bacterium]
MKPSTPPTPPTAAMPCAASAISGHLDTRTAATEIAGDLYDHLGGTCDLAVLFGSFHHAAAFAEAADSIRQTIMPTTMLGVTAESVLGVDRELEGLAGMSVLAVRVPGATLHPWRISGSEQAALLDDAGAMREHLGITDDFRAIIMFADPFSTPITRLLPAITGCGKQDRPIAVVGGMSSGASQPGHNPLILDGEMLRSGAVGVTISGPVTIDIIVSQGCRPIGKPIVITRAKGNVIQELGGRRALDIIQEMTGKLDEHERQLLSGGLLVGTVINEYKDRFGRGDFLVRNILGYDKEHGAIAVGDMPRIGQTVQFHVRDAVTAHEDLQLLLDGQQLDEAPLGAMLVTCNGRGSRLFKDERIRDVKTIRNRLGDIPLAGFFAAGEIGPIGNESFLHGHTASLAIFRAT